MNPANQPNKGRRVTDKGESLLTAAGQAIRIVEVEHAHALLSSQVKNSIDNMTGTLQAVQADSRKIMDRMSELAGLQSAHDSNKVSIDEVKKQVGDLDKRLESWFDDFDRRNDKRWEAYESNRDAWRREHEASNENSERDLVLEIRTVRETVIRFMGYGSALGALAGVIIGGFLWNINYRFSESKEDLQQATQTSAYNRQLIDGTVKELVDIKLYLARGGRMPEEPYIPQSQRTQSGQEHKPGK